MIILSSLPSCLWLCQSKRPQSSWHNHEGPYDAASWQHWATRRWGWPYLSLLCLVLFREPDERIVLWLVSWLALKVIRMNSKDSFVTHLTPCMSNGTHFRKKEHTDSKMATPLVPMLPLGVTPRPPISPAHRSLEEQTDENIRLINVETRLGLDVFRMYHNTI